MKQFIADYTKKQIKKQIKNSYVESVEFTNENVYDQFTITGYPGDIETKMTIKIQFLSSEICIYWMIDSAMHGKYKSEKKYTWKAFDLDYIPNLVKGYFKYTNTF